MKSREVGQVQQEHPFSLSASVTSITQLHQGLGNPGFLNGAGQGGDGTKSVDPFSIAIVLLSNSRSLNRGTGQPSSEPPSPRRSSSTKMHLVGGRAGAAMGVTLGEDNVHLLLQGKVSAPTMGLLKPPPAILMAETEAAPCPMSGI